MKWDWAKTRRSLVLLASVPLLLASCHPRNDDAKAPGIVEFPKVDLQALEEVSTVAALPRSVQDELREIPTDSFCQGIADIGQRFSKGCMAESGTPCRGVLFAAGHGDLWLVYYQAG